MWVTIYCDASFKEGKAAGGYWIKSNHRRIIDSAVIECRDNNVAEIKIALLAIQRCIKDHLENSITGILLVSDNMTVINGLKYKGKLNSNKHIREIQEQVIKILADNKIMIRVKHQKGHSNNSTRPAWLNNKVDQIAKHKRES